MDNSNQTLNIREIWQNLIKYKWYLIMPVIIVPLTTILAAFFITPTYESSTSILINKSNVLPPDVKRGLGEGSGYSRQSPRELQNALSNQIKSTKYIRSLIAKLDIPSTASINKLVSEHTASMPDISAAELAENLLVQSIREQVDVQLSGSNIMKISVTSSSPVMARKMTGTLAEIFLEESLAQELAGSQGSISFTEEQLSVFREKLYSAQNKLKQYRQSIIVSSVDEDTTTLNYNLNSILSAIEALDLDISEADHRRADIALYLRTRKVDPLGVILPDNIKKLKEDLMVTIPQLAGLLGRYNWRDARVVTLNQETKEITNNIEREIESFVTGKFPELSLEMTAELTRYVLLDIKIEFMRNKNTAMQKSIGKIKSFLTRDPAIEVTLERLQSEVNRYRKLYDTFVQHLQYAAIDQSAKKVEAQSKYMIVQPAMMPLAPINPNRVKLTILGLILGTMIGGGVILLLILLDDSFKTVEDVESYLNLPVVATIPRIVTPYPQKKSDRGLIYAGTAISLILIGAILFMKFKGG